MSHLDKNMQSWGKHEEYKHNNKAGNKKSTIDKTTTLVEENDKNILVKLKNKLKKKRDN